MKMRENAPCAISNVVIFIVFACLCASSTCLVCSECTQDTSSERFESLPSLQQTLAWWKYPLSVARRFHNKSEREILQPRILYEPSMQVFLDRIRANATEREDTSLRVYVFRPLSVLSECSKPTTPNALLTSTFISNNNNNTAPAANSTTTTTPLVSFTNSLAYLLERKYDTTLTNHNLFCTYWGKCLHYLYILPTHSMAQKMLLLPLFFAHFGHLHDTLLYVDLDAHIQAKNMQLVQQNQPHELFAYDALLRAPGSDVEFLFQGGIWPNGGILGLKNRPWVASFWGASIRRFMHSYWTQTDTKLLLDQFAFHAELLKVASDAAAEKDLLFLNTTLTHNQAHVPKNAFAGWEEVYETGCLEPKTNVECDYLFLNFALDRFAANNMTQWLLNPCMFPDMDYAAPLSTVLACDRVLETSIGRACNLDAASSFFGSRVRCQSPIPVMRKSPRDATIVQEAAMQYVFIGGYDQTFKPFALFSHTGSGLFSPLVVEEENKTLKHLAAERFAAVQHNQANYNNENLLF